MMTLIVRAKHISHNVCCRLLVRFSVMLPEPDDTLSHKGNSEYYCCYILICQHVSHESDALINLLDSICTSLEDDVADIKVPTWSPQVAAYRFGMSVRLLRNVFLWEEIFVMPVVQKLVRDCLLQTLTNQRLYNH